MPDATVAERFARAGLIGLRMLDTNEGRGRRFGGEADARWEGFRGHLHLGDRIELLLRDASVVFGAAFAPAQAFLLPALAEDDPFGPDWPRLDRVTGRRLWDEAVGISTDAAPAALLELAAQAQQVQRANDVEVGLLAPATRLLVSGHGALHAVVTAFAGDRQLDWPEQVLAVADDPTERQLAGLAAVLLGSPSRTRLLDPTKITSAEEALQAVRDAGAGHLDRALVSSDASAGPRRLVELLRGPLGLAG